MNKCFIYLKLNGEETFKFVTTEINVETWIA
jgi:hypothetical protein